jgi:hypothetical protein
MCIEGVRRLATPTGATLLRTDRVPTASGVRKVLGRLIAQTNNGDVMLDARACISARSRQDHAAVSWINRTNLWLG